MQSTTVSHRPLAFVPARAIAGVGAGSRVRDPCPSPYPRAGSIRTRPSLALGFAASGPQARSAWRDLARGQTPECLRMSCICSTESSSKVSDRVMPVWQPDSTSLTRLPVGKAQATPPQPDAVPLPKVGRVLFGAAVAAARGAK